MKEKYFWLKKDGRICKGTIGRWSGKDLFCIDLPSDKLTRFQIEELIKLLKDRFEELRLKEEDLK